MISRFRKAVMWHLFGVLTDPQAMIASNISQGMDGTLLKPIYMGIGDTTLMRLEDSTAPPVSDEDLDRAISDLTALTLDNPMLSDNYPGAVSASPERYPPGYRATVLPPGDGQSLHIPGGTQVQGNFDGSYTITTAVPVNGPLFYYSNGEGIIADPQVPEDGGVAEMGPLFVPREEDASRERSFYQNITRCPECDTAVLFGKKDQYLVCTECKCEFERENPETNRQPKLSHSLIYGGNLAFAGTSITGNVNPTINEGFAAGANTGGPLQATPTDSTAVASSLAAQSSVAQAHLASLQHDLIEHERRNSRWREEYLVDSAPDQPAQQQRAAIDWEVLRRDLNTRRTILRATPPREGLRMGVENPRLIRNDEEMRHVANAEHWGDVNARRAARLNYLRMKKRMTREATRSDDLDHRTMAPREPRVSPRVITYGDCVSIPLNPDGPTVL